MAIAYRYPLECLDNIISFHSYIDKLIYQTQYEKNLK